MQNIDLGSIFEELGLGGVRFQSGGASAGLVVSEEEHGLVLSLRKI